MPDTSRDVSGTVIQGENQLSGTAGWGKSEVTPPKYESYTCIKLSPGKEVWDPGSQQIESEDKALLAINQDQI